MLGQEREDEVRSQKTETDSCFFQMGLFIVGEKIFFSEFFGGKPVCYVPVRRVRRRFYADMWQLVTPETR